MRTLLIVIILAFALFGCAVTANIAAKTHDAYQACEVDGYVSEACMNSHQVK